jgi:hypothetical protein
MPKKKKKSYSYFQEFGAVWKPKGFKMRGWISDKD